MSATTRDFYAGSGDKPADAVYTAKTIYTDKRFAPIQSEVSSELAKFIKHINEFRKASTDLQNKMHTWLQSLLELQSATGDSSEFLEHVKVDLFPDEVYVFTPKGKILALPRGATVIDFAYAVHTDIGHRCVAARVDHELIPLSAELANGNQVEIITSLGRTISDHHMGIIDFCCYIFIDKIIHSQRNIRQSPSPDTGIIQVDHIIAA